MLSVISIVRGVRGLSGAFPLSGGAGIFRPSRFTVRFSFVAYVVYFLVGLRLQRASLSFVAKESEQRKASPAGGFANMCFAPVV